MAGVITWREQLALDSALRVVDRWPAIALDALSQAQRRQYFKRCEIVKAVLNGTPTKSVAATFGISQSHVYDLLRRTLASPPDQRPALRNGLVRGRRIRPYKRHKPLGQSSQGAAGAFTWLQHEAADVFAALDDQIRRSVRGMRHAEHVTCKGLHARLIQRLQDGGWSEADYPFTNASYAWESFRRWYVVRHAHHQRQSCARTTSEASGRHGTLSPAVAAPFREIQIDAWRIDAMFGLTLVHDTGYIERLEVARFWLLAAVDSQTTAVVAYRYGFNTQVTQDDLLDLLGALCQRWQPMTLTRPGLAYPSGSGLPSGLIDEAAYAAPTIICLDNAWAHQAHRVRQFVVQTMRGIFNCGHPRQPTARRLVETLFKRMAVAVHRLPNTTGSTPHDPRRLKNAKHHSGRDVSIDECRELLELVICDYNAAKPRADLRGASPLEQMRRACDAGYLIRQLGPAARHEGAAFTATRRVTIHTSRSLGVKPWITLVYQRYRGPCLARYDGSPRVEVRYDTRDIRFLEVYTLAGTYLGPVEVQGTWRAFKHDARFRAQVCREAAQSKRRAGDPMNRYLNQLLEAPATPARALELHRLRELVSTSGPQPSKHTIDSNAAAPGTMAKPDPGTPARHKLQRLRWRPLERPPPTDRSAS